MSVEDEAAEAAELASLIVGGWLRRIPWSLGLLT